MNISVRRGSFVTIRALSSSGPPIAANAQVLPSRPIALADGQVTLGGDLSVTIGPSDPGHFNYTDYELSMLRLVRGELSAAVKVGDRVTLLGALRSENGGNVRPHAIYIRVKPWLDRQIDIQAGRIPPTFGAFSRRTYAGDNPLIGAPIAYQYLTSLRGDSLPATSDELLQNARAGFVAAFLDRQRRARARRRDREPLQLGHRRAAAFDDRGGGCDDLGDGRHLVVPDLARRQRSQAHRRTRRRAPGDGPGGRRVRLARSVPQPHRRPRRARRRPRGRVHADRMGRGRRVPSQGHYILRAETLFSDWTIPLAGAPEVRTPLSAMATSIEGKYTILPGLYAAARFDRLGFSEIMGSSGSETWDAPVTRAEIGGGYSLQRNLLLKLAYQYNVRDAGAVRRLSLFAAQLHFWF